jgi:hypothetical protein
MKMPPARLSGHTRGEANAAFFPLAEVTLTPLPAQAQKLRRSPHNAPMLRLQIGYDQRQLAGDVAVDALLSRR